MNHAQEVMAREGVVVVLYGRPGCVQCDATERLFRKRGVRFAKVDVSTDPAALDFTKSLDYMQAPVVYTTTETGDFHWSGFHVTNISEHITEKQAAA